MKSMYNQYVIEQYKKNHEFTFKDFMDICNKLQYPVFEVSVNVNPFSEPYVEKKSNMYNNIEEYRQTMPFWSAKHYDYENDRVTYWLTIPNVRTGRSRRRMCSSSCKS